MPARDTTAPKATITQPASGATITTSTMNISSQAVDSVGVTSMKLYVNNTLVASSTFAASKNTTRYLPYTYTFPSDGSYTIRVEARDASNNLGQQSISVIKSSTTTTTTTAAPPVVLPASFIMNTPPVIYQGAEGSCGSMGVIYCTYSTARYYKQGATSYNYSTNVYSPEYVYDQVKTGTDCASGSSIIQNFGFLRTDGAYANKGCCFWNTLPYTYNPVGCQTNPCDSCIITSSMIAEANTQTITSYWSVPVSDVIGMKQAMYVKKSPLAFSCSLDANLYNIQCGAIWNSLSGINYGGHIMAIVGWDDSKQAWLIQNSYGTQWGCNGFAWVDYTFFQTVTFSVYGMTI